MWNIFNVCFCCINWKINFNVNIYPKWFIRFGKYWIILCDGIRFNGIAFNEIVINRIRLNLLLSIQLLNELPWPYHLTYNLSPLLLITFSILNSCWLVFYNYFFTIEIINKICSWNYIFNFTNNKNFFRPVWCVSFSKNVFVFRNSSIIANFKFRIFIINLFLKINICIIFNISQSHLNCSMICIIMLTHYII